jgi:hypothetical protein
MVSFSSDNRLKQLRFAAQYGNHLPPLDGFCMGRDAAQSPPVQAGIRIFDQPPWPPSEITLKTQEDQTASGSTKLVAAARWQGQYNAKRPWDTKFPAD